MNNNYIALTLGPITRVISLAKKTRGMWAASYLFSYLAKQIIAPFKDKDRQFILPYLATELFNEKSEAGTFPDRYIFQSKEGDFDLLEKQVDVVFNELAGKLCPANKKPEEVKTMLMQYFKVYFFEKERKSELPEREFVEGCERKMALLEQRESFVPSIADDEHYLSRLFNAEKKEMRIMNFLLQDAGIGKFKSIVEITSQDDDENIQPKYPYQRYIAIVYADGDSMGKAFATASNSGELSKKLYDFNKAAIATIKGYDGQPIFIGGDDLFFFAPIFNPGKGSIFTLLDSLEGDFRKALDNDCPASLSFGVSITYYKYPMSEAVRLAQELLDDAKGRYVQSDTIKKNNILFSVQKHSGHTRGALIHKGCAKTVSLFNQFADKYSISKSEDDKDEANNGIFLRSVMHNLREHEPIILNAINDSNLLQNYFDNNYNEPVHDSYKGFFKDLKCLMLTAYYEYGQEIEGLKPLMPPTADGMGRSEEHDAAYAAIDLVYALLQFIHLVNSQRDV